jgi:hypothetical protein
MKTGNDKKDKHKQRGSHILKLENESFGWQIFHGILLCGLKIYTKGCYPKVICGKWIEIKNARPESSKIIFRKYATLEFTWRFKQSCPLGHNAGSQRIDRSYGQL